jgi:hypothetical protein
LDLVFGNGNLRIAATLEVANASCRSKIHCKPTVQILDDYQRLMTRRLRWLQMLAIGFNYRLACKQRYIGSRRSDVSLALPRNLAIK